MKEHANNATDEEILFPELDICDPHQHFFNSPDFRYMPDDLINDISSGHKIVSTVYVDCRNGYRADGPESLKPVGETEYIEKLLPLYEIDKRINIAAGIVGFADLKLGNSVKPVLEAHLAASPRRFRGIRNVAAWDGDPAFSKHYNAPQAGLLLDADFRNGFACLRQYHLSFDAMLFHTQLPELVDLARTFPDTAIIIDHTGVPLGIGPYADRQEEVFNYWKQGIAKASECENVFLKIGGFGMDVGAYRPDKYPQPISAIELSEIIRPYCLWCIEKFGVNRCMFESNFPVDKEFLSYAVVWNAFKRVCRGLSPQERQALFHDTAARVYRI